MGIYITQPSTDKEDIEFLQQLIKEGGAYIKNKNVYKDDKVLWEHCDLGVKPRFLGDPGPFQSIFGYGRFTRDGYTFLFIKLQQSGRTTTLI